MGKSPFRSRLRWNAAVVVLQQVPLTPSIGRHSAACHLDSTSQGQQEWPDLSVLAYALEATLAGERRLDSRHS